MAAEILKSDLVYGKFPGQKKWVNLFLEATAKELRIYEGQEKTVQWKGRQLRTLKLAQSDLVGEKRSKKSIFTFFVQRPDGRYLFKCENGTERGEWILLIQKATMALQRSASGSASPVDKRLMSSGEHRGSSEQWKELLKYRWFWGPLGRRDCEERLHREARPGNFVVRVNSSDAFVMSGWVSQAKITHSLIVHRNNLFCFDKTSIHAEGPTIVEFLESYLRQPIRNKLVPFGGHLYTTTKVTRTRSCETTDGRQKGNYAAAVRPPASLGTRHQGTVSPDGGSKFQSHLLEDSVPGFSTFANAGHTYDQPTIPGHVKPFLTPQMRRKTQDSTHFHSVSQRTQSNEDVRSHQPVARTHSDVAHKLHHKILTQSTPFSQAVWRHAGDERPVSPLVNNSQTTMFTFEGPTTEPFQQHRQHGVESARQACLTPQARLTPQASLTPQPSRHQYLESVLFHQTRKASSFEDISARKPAANDPAPSPRFQAANDTRHNPAPSRRPQYENWSVIFPSKQEQRDDQPLEPSTAAAMSVDGESENKGNTADQSGKQSSETDPGGVVPSYMNVRHTQPQGRNVHWFTSTQF